MLCYEDDANECETKNWLELKIEGKFWGATETTRLFLIFY